MTNTIAGNVYDKYGSKNLIVRILMKNFFQALNNLIANLPVTKILEIGCGEGEIGKRLKSIFPAMEYIGTDISEEIVNEAKKRNANLKFETVSIYDIDKLNFTPDLVVASEVFEHLENPVLGMEKLLNLNFRYLFISVPREPLWRFLNVVRGKYLSDLGNTPGHTNHWSKNCFLKFINHHSEQIRIVKILHPVPWTMILCEKKNYVSNVFTNADK